MKAFYPYAARPLNPYTLIPYTLLPLYPYTLTPLYPCERMPLYPYTFVDAVHLAFRGACKTHHVVLFFPQGVTVVWEITHIYPLHVGPWQRSLPRSPGSQETPPQNRTKQYRNKHPILGQEATDIRTIQHRTEVKRFEGSNRTKIL